MARSLRGYVRIGLMLTEGLAFNLESVKGKDSDFFRYNLIDAFRLNPPSRWMCNPIFPSSNNEFSRGIEYSLNIDDVRKVKIRKVDVKDNQTRYELEVQIMDGNPSRIGGLRESSEFLEKIFEHVHKYADHAF